MESGERNGLLLSHKSSDETDAVVPTPAVIKLARERASSVAPEPISSARADPGPTFPVHQRPLGDLWLRLRFSEMPPMSTAQAHPAHRKPDLSAASFSAFYNTASCSHHPPSRPTLI